MGSALGSKPTLAFSTPKRFGTRYGPFSTLASARVEAGAQLATTFSTRPALLGDSVSLRWLRRRRDQILFIVMGLSLRGLEEGGRLF